MDGAVQIERRVCDRVASDIALTCRVPAQPVKARILDLSLGGCRVALSRHHTQSGASIILELPNGDRINGQVMWVNGSQAGVAFSRSLKAGTARMLGIESQSDVTVTVEPDEQFVPQNAGILQHWIRRVAKIFG